MIYSRGQSKRFFMSFLMRTSLFGLSKTRRARSIWAFPRQEFWFTRMLGDQIFQQNWRSDFRMTQQTFMSLVELVRPRLQKRDTQLRRATPVEKRVAIATWMLATGNSFRSVAVG